jgi:regulator of nucleoside diphosphate kinase
MTDRVIYITSRDRERLETIISQMTEAKDRDDLADLVDELNRAIVVPAEEIPSDVITMNSRVRLLDLGKRTAAEYTLRFKVEAVLYQPEAAGDTHL